MKNKNFKNKFMVGGKVSNFITNPDTTLTNFEIDRVKQEYEASNSPAMQILDIVGKLTPLAMNAITPKIPTNPTPTFSKGGITGSPIEVERDELIERPDGSILDFKDLGKKHSEGGIKLDTNIVPPGSEVHSAQVSINGKSMADYKREYEKKLRNIDKLIEKNSMDRNLINTRKIFEKGYNQVNERNMYIQDILRRTSKKFETGGIVDEDSPRTYEDLTDDEIERVEKYAEDNDLTFDEAYSELYENEEEIEEDTQEEEVEEEEDFDLFSDEEEEEDEDFTNEEYAFGGTVDPKKSVKDLFPPIGDFGIAYSSKNFNNYLNKGYTKSNPYGAIGYNNFINSSNFNTLLKELGYDKFDLSSKDDVKSLQQKLGMPTKLQTGFLGNLTNDSIDKYYKSKPDIYNDKNVFNFVGEPLKNSLLENTEFNPENLPTINSSVPNLSAKASAKSVLDKILETSDKFMGNYSVGDLIGAYGAYKGSKSGLENTERNRAGDRPHKNYMEGYGEETLKLLDKSMQSLKSSEQQALNDLELSRNASNSRLRNSARGINTLRALGIQNDSSVDNSVSKTRLDYANKISELINQKANFVSRQDEIVRRGEIERDMNNRRDRDNYFSQKGQDLQSLHTGTQHMGRILNEPINRKIQEDLISAMSKYFNVDISPNGAKLKNKNKK